MSDAVSRLVRPGMSLAMGLSLEAAVPFAVGYEIIRQQRGDLTLIGPISHGLFDMMIGGGVVGRLVAAWVGNAATGSGYNFRRAVEKAHPRPVEVIDHSNLSLATALDAGSMGLPCGLLRSLSGSEMVRGHPDFMTVSCPFTGRELTAVRALKPDLAVVHAQRADDAGNTHLWGSLGVVPEAVLASRQVLVVVEEVVSSEVIRSDPNRTLVPGFKVAAVVEEPWGAHPSSLQGYYGHDDGFFIDYAKSTREPEGARAWFEEWVFGPTSRRAYLRKLGEARLAGLRIGRSAPAAFVEYGY